jgi:hypothetical protein
VATVSDISSLHSGRVSENESSADDHIERDGEGYREMETESAFFFMVRVSYSVTALQPLDLTHPKRDRKRERQKRGTETERETKGTLNQVCLLPYDAGQLLRHSPLLVLQPLDLTHSQRHREAQRERQTERERKHTNKQDLSARSAFSFMMRVSCSVTARFSSFSRLISSSNISLWSTGAYARASLLPLSACRSCATSKVGVREQEPDRLSVCVCV